MTQYNSFKKRRKIDDFLGGVFRLLWRDSRRRKLPSPIKKITIIKLGSLGDSIISLPIIRFLKKKTGAKIVVVHSKENEPIYQHQSFIDKTVLLNITGKNPFHWIINIINIISDESDICIDLSYTTNLSAILARLSSRYAIGFENKINKKRNSFFDFLSITHPEEHLIRSYASLLKPLSLEEGYQDLSLIKIPYSKEDRRYINQLIPKNKKIIGIHCCHIISYKSWPKENFAKVISYLKNRGYTLYLVGSKKEYALTEEIIHLIGDRKGIFNLCGKTSISQLACAMEKFDFFIANDGGLMHLAASMKTPTLGIFGVESPLRYAPFNTKSFSLYSGDPLKPLIRAYELTWPKKSRKDFFNISSEEVINVIERKFM